MQFEFTLSPDDMEVLLNDCTLTRKKFVLKQRGLEEIENCIAVDYNEKTKIAGIVCKEGNHLTLKNISFHTIESIEFESFHTYKGVAARIFIVE